MAALMRPCSILSSAAVSHRVFPALVYTKRCIRVGDPLPDVVLYEKSPDNGIPARELYKGKRTHIPDFLALYEKFKDEGYMISCLAVNDPFVMDAWGKFTNADGKIRMLADTLGEFTRAMGMEIECKKMLGTNRSQKYSLVVEDGIIQSINVDPDHTGLACLLCIRTMKSSSSS